MNQTKALEDKAKPAAYAGPLHIGEATQCTAIENSLPLRRPFQGAEQRQKCSLAGTRWASHRAETPSGYHQGDLLDCSNLTRRSLSEVLANLSGLEHRSYHP